MYLQQYLGTTTVSLYLDPPLTESLFVLIRYVETVQCIKSASSPAEITAKALLYKIFPLLLLHTRVYLSPLHVASWKYQCHPQCAPLQLRPQPNLKIINPDRPPKDVATGGTANCNLSSVPDNNIPKYLPMTFYWNLALQYRKPQIPIYHIPQTQIKSPINLFTFL